MNVDKDVANMARALQQDCHQTVENIKEAVGKDFDYQNATNVWIMKKFAEYEVRL